MSPKTSTADAGESGNRQLTTTVSPEEAENKDVSYSISPSAEGLTISANGLIEWTENTPVGVYTTTVTTDDGGFTDTHTLTLNELEEGD